MKIELELNDKGNGKSIDIYIEDENGVHHAHFYGKEAETMFTLVRDLITIKENDIFRKEERNGKNKSSKFNSKRKRNRS